MYKKHLNTLIQHNLQHLIAAYVTKIVTSSCKNISSSCLSFGLKLQISQILASVLTLKTTAFHIGNLFLSITEPTWSRQICKIFSLHGYWRGHGRPVGQLPVQFLYCRMTWTSLFNDLCLSRNAVNAVHYSQPGKKLWLSQCLWLDKIVQQVCLLYTI